MGFFQPGDLGRETDAFYATCNLLARGLRFREEHKPFYTADLLGRMRSSVYELVGEDRDLLQETVRRVGGRLMANHCNVIPAGEDWEPNEEDRYYALRVLLYERVRKVKWLLFEERVGGSVWSYEEVVTALEKLEWSSWTTAMLHQDTVAGIPAAVCRRAVNCVLGYIDTYYEALLSEARRPADEDEGPEDESFAGEREYSLELVDAYLREYRQRSLEEVFRGYLEKCRSLWSRTWYGNVPHFLSETLTRKNVYSVAKSFSHAFDPQWAPLPAAEIGPSPETFRRRWAGDFPEFSVNRYLRRVWSGFPERTSQRVLAEVVERLPRIVADSLRFSGFATEVAPPARPCRGGDWGGLLAVHWLTQVRLFHALLHQRVFFFTGSTGVGKSTQVPKLLLYAGGAFLGIPNYRVVCSQPRRLITKLLASRVAEEMGSAGAGVVVSRTGDDVSVVETPAGESLEFVTDGKLLDEITSNLYLLRLTAGGEFLPESTVDVVVVDEAHTHSSVMDLSVAVLRYVTRYNPFLKVLIMSATLTEELPLYQNFFGVRDAAWVRLRQSTRFPIRFTELAASDLPYEAREALAKKLVLSLVQRAGSADILVFSVGKAEVEELVSFFQSRVPPDWEVLPFYREKDLPEQLSARRRKIIVATNVAEVSLTLRSLRTVVDMGMQKYPVYDPDLDTVRYVLRNVDASSATQRAGRVGRVAPGHVYRLFPASALSTPIYAVQNERIIETLLRLVWHKPRVEDDERLEQSLVEVGGGEEPFERLTWTMLLRKRFYLIYPGPQLIDRPLQILRRNPFHRKLLYNRKFAEAVFGANLPFGSLKIPSPFKRLALCAAAYCGHLDPATVAAVLEEGEAPAVENPYDGPSVSVSSAAHCVLLAHPLRVAALRGGAWSNLWTGAPIPAIVAPSASTLVYDSRLHTVVPVPRAVVS